VRRDGNREGSGNHLSNHPDSRSLGRLCRRTRESTLARRDGPTVGCAYDVAVRHRSQQCKPASRLQRGSPEGRTPITTSPTQSPLWTCSPRKTSRQAAAAAPQPSPTPRSEQTELTRKCRLSASELAGTVLLHRTRLWRRGRFRIPPSRPEIPLRRHSITPGGRHSNGRQLGQSRRRCDLIRPPHAVPDRTIRCLCQPNRRCTSLPQSPTADQKAGSSSDLVSSIVFRPNVSPAWPLQTSARQSPVTMDCTSGPVASAAGPCRSSRIGFQVHQLGVNEPKNPFSGGTEDDNE
jgi:hypothetical protein